MLSRNLRSDRIKWVSFALLILGLLWFSALIDLQSAQAQTATPTFVPTPNPQTFNLTCDSLALENAIISSNSAFGNDIINLQAGCTYFPSGLLAVSGFAGDALTINGNGATIFAAAPDDDIMYVGSENTLFMSRVTLYGGYDGLQNYGTANLSNITVGWNNDYGIYNEGTLTLTDSKILNNTVNGVSSYFGTMSITRTNISGNGQIYGYAGVYNYGGTLIISESSITNNGAGVQSYSYSSGNVGITRTTLANNAENGFYIVGGGTAATINNSTVSGNGLPSVFGGESSKLTATLRNTTITNNTFGDQTGALEFASNVDLTIENSIIAGNTIDPKGDEITIYASADPTPVPSTIQIILEGSNFLGTINASLSVSGTTNRVLTGNPALLALSDNGAFGHTHKPSLASPVLDAGPCTATIDQRGVSRPVDLPGINTNSVGFCDIGAVEVQQAAINDSYTAVFETPLFVAAPGVLGNDGATNVALALLSPTVNGGIALNADGSFTYTPDAGFLGSDSFTYSFIRNGSESNVARVLINVVAPIASDDIFVVEAGQTLTVPAPGVLANDKNPEQLIANLAGDPLNGTVTLAEDGSFTYIPNPGFSGADRFFYTVTRGEINSSRARVVISVTGSGADGETIYNPAPSNLRIEGSLVEAPIVLTFRWDVIASRVGQDILDEYHNLRITDDEGFVLYEEWLPAAQICTGLTCEQTVQEEDLSTGAFTNGFYRWSIQTWTNGIFSRLSDERGFEVDVSTPTLLGADIQVDTSSGRPIVLFPDNPNALWYQIFIGEQVNGGLALRHLRWYKKDEQLCADGICRFYPTSNPVTGNYELWVQTWGPAGFGVGDIQTDIGGWAGPIPFAMDFSPPQPAAPMTVTYADSGRPQYSWQHMPGSTWFQIWTYDESDPPTYYSNIEWVASIDAGCLESLTCTYTPNFGLGNNRTYQWYMQTWGPGGFGSKGNINDPFDRWVEGTPYAVNAPAPDAPQAITPTKVITKPLALTYTWMHQPNVSWYQFEIRQIDDLPESITPVSFSNWYANEDLGCRDGTNVCVLDVPSLLLPDGTFQWRLRAWNPSVTDLSDDQWSEWVAFSVTRQ